jgi:hypothetical protein
MQRQSSSTLLTDRSDFAFPDTASLTQIFLADKFGNSVLLKRAGNGWTANGKPAIQENVLFLLDAIRNIEVRHPVAKAAYNNIMKQMAATGIKVELYVKDKKVKTYYVGHETQDQMGTYMYLENSSVPYAMHIPGFNGILNVRYNTNEKAWWKRTVFSFSPEEIYSIVVENRLNPEKSFDIVREKNTWMMRSYPEGRPYTRASEEKLLHYISEYGNINYERELSGRSSEIDSILQAGPMMIITVKTQAAQRTAWMYPKPRTESHQDEWLRQRGPMSNYDPDRFYLQIDTLPQIFTAQYFVFRKLMRTPEDFFLTTK